MYSFEARHFQGSKEELEYACKRAYVDHWDTKYQFGVRVVTDTAFCSRADALCWIDKNAKRSPMAVRVVYGDAAPWEVLSGEAEREGKIKVEWIVGGWFRLNEENEIPSEVIKFVEDEDYRRKYMEGEIPAFGEKYKKSRSKGKNVL